MANGEWRMANGRRRKRDGWRKGKPRTSNIQHPTLNGAGAPDVGYSMFDVRCSMLISFSLVGRGVNIRDGHELAEQMHPAGLLLQIRGAQRRRGQRPGMLQWPILQHAQLQFHRRRNGVAEHIKLRLAISIWPRWHGCR